MLRRFGLSISPGFRWECLTIRTVSRFPQGCPYGKPDEQQYDIGFLEKVAEAMLKHSEAVTEVPV